MSKTKRTGLVLVFLICVLSFGEALYALPGSTSRVGLRLGMTYSEVQALWGEPTEVVEQEILHQSIWRYAALKNSPATTLRFVRGTLVVDTSKDLENNSRKPDLNGKENSPEVTAKSKPHSFMALRDQHQLEEILKDVPNEPEGAGDKAGPGRNGAAAMPAPIE